LQVYSNKKEENMKLWYVVILSLIVIGCSKTNLSQLEDKKIITAGEDLIFTQSIICNEHKSSNNSLFACGTGISSDIEISRKQAILSAKVFLADQISATVVKNESSNVKETTKDGLVKSYTLNESNSVNDTILNRYQVVYDKVFYDGGKYRSFVILKISI